MPSKVSSPAVAGGGSSTSAITAATVTGSHVLKVNDYSQTLGISIGSYINSGKFFAAGRSWNIRYYPCGFDEESRDSISLFLVLKGSRNSVRVRFMFSLLDPEGNRAHSIISYCPVVLDASKSSWGFPSFIKREDLGKSKCLQDNSFRIVCDITVLRGFYTEAPAKFVAAVPASDLYLHLGCLLSSGIGSDVTFRVHEKLFRAHKNVLAARSSVFMAELFGPLKEKATDCLQIDDMEPEVFRAMLQFIYTDLAPEMQRGGEIAMAQHLLVAADRYDLKRLKLICEDKLCSRVSKRTAATTLVLAEQHGCHGLKKACVAFLSSLGNLEAVMGIDGYDHLRSSCPSLHDELVAKFDVSKRKNKNKSFWCFCAQ